MKLTVKFAAAFALMFAVMAGAAWLVLDRFVRAEFHSVEVQQHEQDTRRVAATFAARARDLAARVTDYASWDDTLAFLNGAAPSYPADNFSDAWFGDYDVDLVLFIDEKGGVAWGRNRTAEGGGFEASKFLFNVVRNSAQNARPTTERPATGVVWTQHGPMLYAARPASASLGTGPGTGLVIIGQYLAAVGLDQQTQLHVEFVSITQPGASEDLREALSKLQAGDLSEMHWQSGGKPESLIALRAADGRIVGAIRAYHTGAIAALGERTVFVAGGLIVVAAGAALLGLWLMFHAKVTAPLYRLERHLKSQAGGFAPFQGRRSSDEIGALIEAYNSMCARTRAAIASEESAILESEAHERANRIKSDFIASMSHELRTPLTAIMGYCELLKEDLRAAGLADAERDLGKIDGAAHHLLALIGEILDMSKIDNGQLDLAGGAFDVADMAREAVEAAAQMAKRNGNTLTLEAADDLGAATTDGKRLRQCVLNLLSNACKFTRNGKIVLRAERFERGGDDWLRFEVHDSGIGMSPEQIGRVFHPFTQADAATTTRFGGAGLGLTITRRLLDLMGGAVSVRSEPGAGSVFTIEAPAALPETAAPALVAA